MNIKNFTYLLVNPQKISVEGQKNLTEVIERYPFFQSARALQLKGLKNDNSYLYNDALKITAAYTTDRNILFDYITSESFAQNEISEIIQQHDESIHEIEVTSENISEQLSIELDNQIKTELKKAEAILNPELFERKMESVEKIIVEETPSNEKLKVDTPLDFTKEDSHSFSEWLKLTAATPINRKENRDITTEKQQNFDLIDKFIQNKPKLSPKNNPAPSTSVKQENKNLASQYTQAPDALMTETLAKVYLQQKNFKKALQAYHILILKYPEKSGFFADQIRAIKKLENS